MKKFIVSLVSMIFLLGISIPAFASPIKSASNEFYFEDNIKKDVNCEGDVYAFAGTVDLSGSTNGDIIAAASEIDINTNNVGGNIRIAGAVLNITSNKVKNITAAGQEININEGTEANGVYLAGEIINFNGIAEELKVAGSTILLNGTVTGKVNISCDKLIIGQDAKIDGIIEVEAAEEPVIEGDIPQSKISFTQISKNNSSNYNIFKPLSKIFSLITALILAMILTLLCKRYLEKGTLVVKSKVWLPLLIGFSALIIVPIVAIIAMFTVVAVPLSFIALIIYGLLIYIAPVISGIILGKVVFKNMNIYLSALIGTVIIKLVMLVPYLGGILFFGAMLLSLGLFVLSLGDRITE